MRRKNCKRLLAAMLCAVMILTNGTVTGVSVQASEIGQLESESSVAELPDVSTESGAEAQAEEKEDQTDSEESEDAKEEESGKGEPENSTENGDTEEGTDNEGNEEEKPNGENTVSEKVESAVVREDYSLTTAESDIASGVIDEEYGYIVWVIDANGKLSVSGWGNYNMWGGGTPPWDDNKKSIKTAEVNITGMTSTAGMFEGCENMKSISFANFNTSNVTSMGSMFFGCSSLTNIDLNGLDTHNVTDMAFMFFGCHSLSSINLSKINVSNVTNMDGMFGSCENLTNIDLAGLDISSVTDMSFMFENCSSLTNIDLSGLDTHNVSDMREMFFGCTNLTKATLGNLDVGNVTSMFKMFSGCSSLTNIDLSGLNATNVTNMREMFSGCSELINVNLAALDASSVTTMFKMFIDCNSLTNIELEGLNISSLTDMRYMFEGCKNLNTINLNGLNTSNVTNMGHMFSGCSSLTSIDLSGLETHNVTNMGSMFSGCSNLSNIVLGQIDISNVTSMTFMFSGCSSLVNLDLSGLDAGNTTHMTDMFYLCNSLTTIYSPCHVSASCKLPDRTWYRSDGSIVTELPQNLSYSIVLGKNYIPEDRELSGISNNVFWEIDKDGTLTLTGSGNWIKDENGLPPWVKHSDRIKKVTVNITGTTNADNMFFGCTNLKSINLCGFDMSLIADASNMFDGCTALDLIYTPVKLSCSVHLPTNLDTDIWYRSDGTALTALPQNLDYSIAVRKNHIPEEIPSSITSCTGGTINGKGISFGQVSMVYQGEVITNKQVRWKFDGYDMDYKLGKTDENGYFMIESPFLSYDANEDNDYTLEASVSYFTGNTWLPSPEKYTMKVKVTPLTLSQKWQLKTKQSIEVGLGGVKVDVGPAKMKASFAEVGTAFSSGGTLSLSHSYDENGMRKVSLMQTISKDIAVKASVGPAVSGEFGTVKGKVTLCNVKGSATGGDSITYGTEILNYDPEDFQQLLQIGKFITTAQMYNTGDVFLKNALVRWGFEDYDIKGTGITSNLSVGASTLGGEISDSSGNNIGFSVNVESAGYDRTYSTKFLKNDCGITDKYEIEIASDVKYGILNFDLNQSKDKIKGISLGSIGISPRNTGISLTTDKFSGKLVGVEYTDKTYTSWGIPFYTNTNTNEITFSTNDSESLQKLDELKNLQKIISKNKTTFFPENYITDTWNGICASTDIMEFDVARKEDSMIKIPISIGLGAGVSASVGVDLSGSSEISYVTQKGFSQEKSLYVTAEMQNTEADINAAKMNLSDFFTAPLEAAGKKIGEFITDTAGKVVDGVKSAGASVGDKLNAGVDWVVHIISFKKNSSRASANPQSFAINTYMNAYSDASETPGVSMTVGDPYLVYVTDASENEISDFTNHPLELRLDYDSASLEAAGVTTDQASALAIYMYSEEKCGYIYLGGQVDTENQQVTADITKPGQYLLAVDTLAPAIYDIYISDTSSKPTITAFFSELSGFSQFSMKIDGVEYVNETTLNQYLDQSSGSFVYKVETPLEDGEHTLSFTATDSRGNATAQPITFVFVVGETPEDNSPEIGDILPEDMPEDGKIPDGLWIAAISDTVYTGKTIKPVPHVYDSDVRLKEGTDYTVTYKNNVKASDASNVSTAPTIIVTGKGNYSGKDTITFKILPIELTESNMTVADMTRTYNQNIQQPLPSITVNGRKLKNKTDFFVSYPDNTTLGAYRDIGIYRIAITGTGNYTGEQILTFDITDKLLISKASVSKILNQAYTGNAVTPTPVVKYQNVSLMEHKDYELEYQNNVDIGKAMVVIKGVGDYAGKKSVAFQITGGSLKKAKVTGLVSPIVYTGEELLQNCSLSILVNDVDIPLQEGKDYTVTYKNNIKAGTAKVIFTGINGYTGTLQKSYKITPYDILSDEGKHIKYTKDIFCTYLKGGSRPEPELHFKDVLLKKGVDYTLSYRNNNAVRGEHTPTIIIKGKGSFKNKIEIPFKIEPQNLSNMTLASCDKVYEDKADIYKITPRLLDINGKALSAGKDFDKNSITYAYEDNVVFENGTFRKAGDKVEDTDIIPANTRIRVTLSCGSGNLYEGTFTGTYRFVAEDIKSAKVSIPAQTYTGSEITPDKTQIRVTLSQMDLSPEDYDIVSYANNIKKGKASVTIIGKGNYGGIKTVKFTIKAKGFFWWWR